VKLHPSDGGDGVDDCFESWIKGVPLVDERDGERAVLTVGGPRPVAVGADDQGDDVDGDHGRGRGRD